jgi:hypothetical protein
MMTDAVKKLPRRLVRRERNEMNRSKGVRLQQQPPPSQHWLAALVAL